MAMLVQHGEDACPVAGNEEEDAEWENLEQGAPDVLPHEWELQGVLLDTLQGPVEFCLEAHPETFACMLVLERGSLDVRLRSFGEFDDHPPRTVRRRA
jgi:hypothetical protein